MSKKMLIDATHPEETRVVVVEGNKVEEFDFESLNKRQIAGNIYLAKVTRVEPSLQAAFVDYGGNRHGFLAFNEIHPDYYQIPVADREKLLAEEAAYAKAKAEEDAKRTEQAKSRTLKRKKSSQPEKEGALLEQDAILISEKVEDEIIDINPEEDALVEVPEAQNPLDIQNSLDTPETAETPLFPEDTDPTESIVEESFPNTFSDALQETLEIDDSEVPKDDSEDLAHQSTQIIADDDISEEVRPQKPRMKRYKIQEVIKVRQIMLIQVVKEERGNKGAALTTYLSLAGRYCVLMPNTARGGGISRKITNATDRKKIKAIANKLIVPEGAGLIIRTAGAKRSETDINRDYEFLTRQWEQIRELTLKSIAPAPIYEEGNLIKRSIRDLYTRDIDEIHVEGVRSYEATKEYMKMFMPSRVDKIKLYQEPMPLFSRYQVESHLAAMFNPTVQLKSGGYIVIGITEALVAIDVNSGRATKESSIEETALKTNLEAAEEIARQLRLRDLAGLIVIDFIDMDEKRHNTAVEKRLNEKLKNDRARIQVGRISDFGLLEMSRQRLRQGMLEATTQPCTHCHGTGLLRSNDSLALSILRELVEEGVRKRSSEVLIKAPITVANYLLNEKRDHIRIIERRYQLAVRIEADISLHGTEYTIEKFKTTTRSLPEPENAPVSVENVPFEDLEDISRDDPDADNEQPKKKSRRRRGGRGRGKPKISEDAQTTTDISVVENGAETQTDGLSVLEDTREDKSQAASKKTAPKSSKPSTSVRKSSARKTTAKKVAKPEEIKDTGTSDATPETETNSDKPSKKAEKPAPKRKPRKKETDTASEQPSNSENALPDVKTDTAGVIDINAGKTEGDTPPKRRGWWSRK